LIEYSAESIFGKMNISPATLFSALAHDTRLRCLLLLLEHDELCVCELTNAIGSAQPHMSRHLGQLREVGLVTDRREGLWIYYRINPELPTWVTNLLGEMATGVKDVEPFVNDLATLASMPNRPVALRCA
jgi:ArsR family transcriptional regulator